MPDVWSEALRVAPLALTVAGWWYVNRENNRREARRERRAFTTAAKSEIVQIADDATSYFMNLGSPLAPKIKWTLDALAIDVEHLAGDGRNRDAVIDALANFADACTGGTFEQADRPRFDHSSPEIGAIHLRRNQLLEALERHFSAKYGAS